MFKLFHKKLNKKGFTLAEMLIVVAIIAILVAIAIPIFTSALDKAHKAARDANIRSVKAVAIYEILDKWEDSAKHYGYATTVGGDAAESWLVDATITDEGDGNNGHIEITDITPQAGTNKGTFSYSEAAGTINIQDIFIDSVKVPS